MLLFDNISALQFNYNNTLLLITLWKLKLFILVHLSLIDSLIRWKIFPSNSCHYQTVQVFNGFIFDSGLQLKLFENSLRLLKTTLTLHKRIINSISEFINLNIIWQANDERMTNINVNIENLPGFTWAVWISI